MSQLRNATVLITGAGGGFGQALTRQLLAKGSQLILTDHPAVNLLAKVQALQGSEATPADQILTCIEADLAHAAGCQYLYDTIQTSGLVPNIVINNAGVALVGNMIDVPPERWEAMLQINLLAPMHLSTLYARDMQARQQGHIVNISSLAGWIAPPGLTAYATSKYGLRGFSEGLRYELAPYHVRVTTVYPFFSRTPLLTAPRFGRLAASDQALPAALTTDPEQIMARTIRAIERNQAEVFPDKFAQVGQWLKRYFPIAFGGLGWLKV
ncbi:MAG: SDR family NAD(P)-dependent oxidoreductase [Leptolyngbyaceae cyanobacterium]